YGSNRGHDTIVVFAIDEKNGKLTHVENQSTRGKTPRNFAIDDTGGWLLAENQESDTIVVFRIEPQMGKLTATGQTIKVGWPVFAARGARETALRSHKYCQCPQPRIDRAV